jgi:hypothetical protein
MLASEEEGLALRDERDVNRIAVLIPQSRMELGSGLIGTTLATSSEVPRLGDEPASGLYPADARRSSHRCRWRR